MSKTVIFVGKATLNIIDYFIKNNYITGLFADVNLRGLLEDEEYTNLFDFVLPVNFTSPDNIKKSFKDTFFKNNTVLFCPLDKYTIASGVIADALNLDQKEFLNTEVARLTTSKILQRRQFEKSFPEISPKFKVVRNFHSAYTFTKKYGFPVIIKPSSLSQSRLVDICNNLEELVTKVSYSLDHIGEIYRANNVYKKPALLIETFIEGDLYSVDSYITQSGEVVHTPACREYTAQELGQEGFGLPYCGYFQDTTKEQDKLILETVEKAIKSLNIKGNVVHTEVKIREGKCQVIEIQLRGGGYRNSILQLAFGIDHNQNIINSVINKEINSDKTKNEFAGYVKIIPRKIGVLKAIKGLKEVEKLESVHKVILDKSVKVGDLIGPNEKGFTLPVVIILHNKDREKMHQDAEFCLKHIVFEVEEIDEQEYQLNTNL
jgi:biotin carboxylase